MKTIYILSIILCLASIEGFSESNLTDEEIKNAVESELLTSDKVSAHLIDVSASEGIVTMDGSVSNLLEKKMSLEIAEKVKGVRAVINLLEVKTKDIPDDQLKKRIEEALLFDPATESYEVATTVNDGLVKLTGAVDSWQEKKMAEFVAMNINGVKEIQNDITVNYKTKRKDLEIEKDIENRMKFDAFLYEEPIDIEVKNGIVMLSGEVGSAFEKDRARINSWVAGVREVKYDDLTVNVTMDYDKIRDKMLVNVTDSEIKNAVQEAYILDPRISSYNPQVDVDKGVVKLTGEVPNLRAKKAAESDAENVNGVTYVQNRLKVRPTVIRTDEEIEKNIKEQFMLDPYLEQYQVGVMVKNSKAYLTGFVASRYEKKRATDLTAKVPGVVDVTNNIQVDFDLDPMRRRSFYNYHWYGTSNELKTDAEIKEDVAQQLFWSPFVDREEVTVDVKDGIVTLKGKVDSRQEKESAVENAYEGGALSVVNNIIIEE